MSYNVYFYKTANDMFYASVYYIVRFYYDR